MKILHFVAGELTGGAARGAYWLHSAQRELGLDSVLLTSGRYNYHDPSVIALADSPLSILKSSLAARAGTWPVKLYKQPNPWIFNTGFVGRSVLSHPAYRAAEIIHLHWIPGLVSLRSLSRIDKPIVWTLRDMWPMTGGCHYSMECERYTVGCGQCPQLGSARDRDLSKLVVATKVRAIPEGIRVVGISKWISECAERSKVFRGARIQTIPNNIDTREFYPIEKAVARQALGVGANQRVLLAGATKISSFYKGFDLLVRALQSSELSDCVLFLFGDVTPDDLSDIPIPVHRLGYLTDAVALRLAYSAADVFVAPSRMDAFGKTLAEAMACGTPVVCFDATGPSDIVVHRETGYKSKPGDAADLARGIAWVLRANEEQEQGIRSASRNRAVNFFDARVIAGQYEKLYTTLLEEQLQS